MMTRPLIVHQLNAVGASHVDFIEISAALGVQFVSIFTFDGGTVLPRSNTGLNYPPALSRVEKQNVAAALAVNGVAIDGIEFFPLTDGVDLSLYAPALDLGAELGAKRVSSHLFIRDDSLVVDKLGALCDVAAARGMKVSSEFCPLTPGNPSLARGKWLVDQVRRANFGIGVDALHVVRSGAAPADIATLDAHYFGIAQINDAHGLHVSSDYITEVHNREIPGKGDLPLHAILSAIPASLPIEIEVPAAHRRAAGVTAGEHVRDVVAGARAIIAGLTPRR
jgi:sugar phosphate isomerase/epimerase